MVRRFRTLTFYLELAKSACLIGTIRKIQHSAIAHDRAAILATAKRRKAVPGQPVAEAVVEKELKESEEAIMALEA